MAVDLLFSQAPATGHPVNLLFGGGDVAAPDIALVTLEGVLPQPVLQASLTVGLIATASLDGLLPVPPLTGLVQVSAITVASLAGVLPPVAGLQALIRIGGLDTATLSGAIPAPELQGDIRLIPATMVFLAGVLPAVQLTAQLGGDYLSNTARPTVGDVAQSWQKAGVISVGTQDKVQDTASMPAGATPAWQPAIRTRRGHETGFVNADRTHSAVGAGFQTAAKQAAAAKALHSNAMRDMRQMLSTAFAEAEKVQTAANRQRHQDGIRDKTSAINGTWQVADRLRAHGYTGTSSPAVWLIKGWGADYENAMRPPAGMYVRPLIVPPKEVCYTPDANLLFRQALGNDLVFICERHVVVPPTPGTTVVVPVQRVYMIFNDVSLRRVDGDIALPNASFTLSLDADSWAWGFSAALPGSALPDLEPASSGAPVELEAMVNGTAFRVLVESISRERTFGKNDIRVQGRGKTALLDSPYAPARNFGNTADRTAQQLMADVLSVNGVSMDWALNWGLFDWSVPAGVFAHQGSYISALNAIAAAAGGYVQPHASLQSLDVLARYPVAPWNWGMVTPDFELPSAVSTREGIEWVERARYNRVFVSGQQSGILGQVTRAGTAGDLLAPMVTDALITTAVAARQRGISVLGNTGRQANISLRLPVLPETGVITPGKFVRYVDAGVNRLGIVRSVSLDAGFPNVWQSIGVETHV